MNYVLKHTRPADAAKHVEVLTSPLTGIPIGYHLNGARPGPNILVSGHAPMAQKIFDRLLALPTLPWLRGSITVIFVEAMDQDSQPRAAMYAPPHQIDELLFLPYWPDPKAEKAAVKEGYWSVLRLCAKLGMIDGRGVA